MKFENNQTKSNTRGGARKGSRRKQGAATKKTREIADKVVKEGITPLEVMLGTMRDVFESANALPGDQDGGGDGRLSLLMRAVSIAKDAAPYVHPRLAAIECKDENDKSSDHQKYGVLVVPDTMSVEEWTQKMAQDSHAQIEDGF